MTPAQKNPNRRRGMHPMRDFQALAADLARFDFSTRSGANEFYIHAADKWTTGEIVRAWTFRTNIHGYDPAEPAERRECLCLSRADGIAALDRYGLAETEAGKAIVEKWKTRDATLQFYVTRTNPVALAIETLSELRDTAIAEIRAAEDRGYLGTKRTHGGTMAEGAERLLEKTIRELQAGRTQRNAHLRKRTGADGKAVTPTEAANALGVSRQTIYALLKDPRNAWGLLPAHITSWAVFRRYLDENADRIAAHKAQKRNRNRRPDIRLTATGRTEDAPDTHATR